MIKLPSPSPDDGLRIHSTAVAGQPESWDITIEVSSRVEYYHIESSKAYSAKEPAYQLTPLHCRQISQDGSVNAGFQGAVVRTTADREEIEWVLLDALPRIDMSESSNQSQAGSVTGMPPRPNLFQLAKHVQSGQVYILRLGEETLKTPEQSSLCNDRGLDDQASCPIPVAKLLSPQGDCAFRNVAVAPLQAMDGSAQVAIIWQNNVESDRKSELYLYEIQGSLWRIFQDRHFRQDGIYSSQTHIQNFDCCVEIQAKRVHSLESGVGGIHLSSPVRNPLRTCDEDCSETQDEPGGLAILQTGQVTASTAYPARQGLYICVWGSPVQSSNHVVLDIFDLSFSNPFLRMLPPELFIDWPVLKVDPYTSEAVFRFGIVCQCALHDHAYRIELPGHPLVKENPGRATRWPLVLLLGATKPTLALDWGSIEHYFPTATQEAWERQAEWMRAQIRKLKQANMTEDMIIEIWFTRRWTGEGLIGFPDGWKTIRV